MATIKLTRRTQYVEETYNRVEITGTNMKNKYVFVEFSDTKHTTGNTGQNFAVRIATKQITNNTSFTFSYEPSLEKLDSIYENTQNTAKLKLNIYISTSYNSTPTTNNSYDAYIEPMEPLFSRPTYEVVDNKSLAFTNDNQIIVNGISTITIPNISAVARKNAIPKYIKINNTKYNYSENIPITIENFSASDYRLKISCIDSRGFESGWLIADGSKFRGYHKPIITETEVERDGISARTKFKNVGIYSEGYQVGIESLSPSYKYQEILSDGSAEIKSGTTSLTPYLTKIPTDEWNDYLAILNEYNNIHTEQNWQGVQVYSEEKWNDYNINELFEISLKYNTKYTKEYLEKDSEHARGYYIYSSGYYESALAEGYGLNTWLYYWGDTLKEILKVIYGTYIYGQDDKNFGIGGNYKYEIEVPAIKGDIAEGFSLDKTFNVWAYINENTNKETMATTVLSTAIPAIDVYKDKIALHGLYDETISDSDIQFWGNVFLNGTKINAGLIQILQTANADFSTNYQYFCPFAGDTDVSLDFSFGDKLTLNRKTVAYGDRTSNNVYGITIGSGVSLIKVNFSVRYSNNYSSSVAVNTLINKSTNNQTADIMYGSSTTIPSSSRLTQTGSFYLEVEEGDFIFLAGFRSIKSADVNVIATDNATNMSIEIIN